MLFTNVAAIALGFFASSGLAAPSWAKYVTVQLANEQSGTNSDITIPIDGVMRPVQELWGQTDVAHEGLVFASSAMLTAFPETTICTFTEGPRLDATLNAEKAYTSFGGVRDLCAAYVMCKCEDF
ncbi:uncharacterized protein N7498_006415 [Penicillium cinerascens]|uniref:Uncharacterized protein n=1 Tax=Penicillium cinerascens TaxID=70096 RepID=A0A9W9SXB8_9EURO|nr:uncharacterized protein N7498_006415 [Penicillium cinerascens]KAJ5201752.1 hypothetical protein N7498_006415 [Penicillium cinerascens]